MADATSNRPLQIFLCHAEEDKEVVWRLYDRLVEEGAEVWLDKRSILPGQTWEKAIRTAVKKSDVVLVCLSKKFNQKGFRQKEVRWALNEAELMLDEDIYIIPVRLEACSVPETLANRQWVDLFDEGGEFNQANYALLLRALREKARMADAALARKSGFFSLPKPKITKPARKTVQKPTTEAVKKATVGQEAAQDAGPNTNPAASKTLLDRVAPDTKAELLPTPPQPKRKWNPTIVAALIAAFATIFAAILGFPPLIRWFESAIAPTATLPIPVTTATHAVPPTNTTFVIDPTFTAQPSLTPTIELTPTSTPYPPEITQKGAKMALVPAGTFTMGSDNGAADEKPAHSVDLPAFYMDIYEVANALYKACVEAGGCTKPQNTSRYDNSQYAEHPVVYVDWNQANAYCAWRGARLPTEAEWEKSARSADGRTYPWGEGIDCEKANYSSCKGDTTPVGSYASGKSPYGIYDMAGNVWEWTADWYNAYPGNTISDSDYGTKYRVLRGGAWLYNDNDVRSANRGGDVPDDRSDNLGFRCALSP
jgi:formylglycine-generating enzyme required for sulfatase activity